MAYVKRSKTHRIDTRAVRKLINALPIDWLVRSLEERDYGIDLQIELFEDDSPTGGMALIQVKGTEDTIDAKNPKLNGFPTKTVEYALLFPQPFFLFYVSATTGSAHFVWIQKYVTAHLNDSTPNWQSQDSVTIEFPADNVLPEVNAQKKIESIVKGYLSLPGGVQFLGRYEALDRAVQEIGTGGIDVSHAAELSLAALEKLKPLGKFIEEHDLGKSVDLIRLENELHYLRRSPDDVESYLREITECMYALDEVRDTLLSQEEVENYALSFGVKPY